MFHGVVLSVTYLGTLFGQLVSIPISIVLMILGMKLWRGAIGGDKIDCFNLFFCALLLLGMVGIGYQSGIPSDCTINEFIRNISHHSEACKKGSLIAEFEPIFLFVHLLTLSLFIFFMAFYFIELRLKKPRTAPMADDEDSAPRQGPQWKTRGYKGWPR